MEWRRPTGQCPVIVAAWLIGWQPRPTDRFVLTSVDSPSDYSQYREVIKLTSPPGLVWSFNPSSYAVVVNFRICLQEKETSSLQLEVQCVIEGCCTSVWWQLSCWHKHHLVLRLLSMKRSTCLRGIISIDILERCSTYTVLLRYLLCRMMGDSSPLETLITNFNLLCCS